MAAPIPPEGAHEPGWAVQHWHEWVPDDPADVPEGFRLLWGPDDGGELTGTATYGRDTGVTRLAVAGETQPIAVHEMETVEVPVHLAVARWRLVGEWNEVDPPQRAEDAWD